MWFKVSSTRMTPCCLPLKIKILQCNTRKFHNNFIVFIITITNITLSLRHCASPITLYSWFEMQSLQLLGNGKHEFMYKTSTHFKLCIVLYKIDFWLNLMDLPGAVIKQPPATSHFHLCIILYFIGGQYASPLLLINLPVFFFSYLLTLPSLQAIQALQICWLMLHFREIMFFIRTFDLLHRWRCTMYENISLNENGISA